MINVCSACRRPARKLTSVTVLEKLRAVSTAAFDAQPNKGCMKNTRVSVLNKLVRWAQDASAPSIFWLAGMAGTGKTSIARSFCDMLAAEADLGGSFFCSRTATTIEQTEVRRILPTLVRALARQHPAFEAAIVAELTAEPDITDKTVEIQVQLLLGKTLSKLPSRRQACLVLVIDGLDECSNPEATAEFILALINLTQDPALYPFPIKFFVTSRPEKHIRATPLSRRDMSDAFVLHDIEPDEVNSDISTFIHARFTGAPVDPSEPSQSSGTTWYSASDIETLVGLSCGLFIFASTVIAFVLARGHAAGREKRLRDVVNSVKPRPRTTEPLNEIYSFILAEASSELEEDECHDLQVLLTKILALREPLSIRGFAELVKISVRQLRALLEDLHAVINVPADNDSGDLRTLHASFSDYLQLRAPNELQVDISLGRELLLRACFDRMQAADLCFNVSRSASSYQRNPDVRPTFIARSLEYACLQWVYHFEEISDRVRYEQMIDGIFLPKLLFWLEVVSVLRRFDDGRRALVAAEFLVISRPCRYHKLTSTIRSLPKNYRGFCAIPRLLSASAATPSRLVHHTSTCPLSHLLFATPLSPIGSVISLFSCHMCKSAAAFRIRQQCCKVTCPKPPFVLLLVHLIRTSWCLDRMTILCASGMFVSAALLNLRSSVTPTPSMPLPSRLTVHKLFLVPKTPRYACGTFAHVNQQLFSATIAFGP